MVGHAGRLVSAGMPPGSLAAAMAASGKAAAPLAVEAAAPLASEATVEALSGSTPPAASAEVAGTEASLKPPEAMTVEERSAFAAKCKDIGNRGFKTGEWEYAALAYEEGLRYLQFAPGEQGCVDTNFDHGGAERLANDATMVAALSLNLAAVMLKIGEERRAVELCSQALSFDATSAKARDCDVVADGRDVVTGAANPTQEVIDWAVIVVLMMGLLVLLRPRDAQYSGDLSSANLAFLAVSRRVSSSCTVGLFIKDAARAVELDPTCREALVLQRYAAAAERTSVQQEKAMFAKMLG